MWARTIDFWLAFTKNQSSVSHTNAKGLTENYEIYRSVNTVNETGNLDTNQNVRNYFVLRTSNVYQSKALYRLRHIILTRNLNSVGNIKFKDLIKLVIDVSDMFLDTKQPKKHQERFIRKLLGDDAYYKRWRDKKRK